MNIRHQLETEGRVHVAKLAERWEVTRDTIKRDLDRLRTGLDMDIEYDRASNSYVYQAPGREELSASEFAALQLAVELFQRIAGTRFERALGRGLDKIRRLLPPEVSVSVDREAAAQTISIDLLRGGRELVSENVALLGESIVGRTSVLCDYFSAYRGQWQERRLDPHHLLFRADAWYCIAWCHRRRDLRLFAVQRMAGLRRTQNRFDPQIGFDPEAYLSNAFALEAGEPEQLTVRFTPAAAIYVKERLWHPSQELEEAEDGSLLFRAQVVCGGEVMRWVLQYGAKAEVLGPPHLRAQVMAELAGMGERYGKQLRR